jgi:hypothetical protein
MTIKPRQPVPPFEVKLLDGTRWRLRDATPAAFEMIVVYRGLHCPGAQDRRARGEAPGLREAREAWVH